MKPDYSFREINPDRGDEKAPAPIFHVAITNAWGDFRLDGLEKILRSLEEFDLEARVSLLDLKGVFQKSEELHLFLMTFPKIRFFLPHASSSPADSLNLFFQESHATYVILLSADAWLKKLDAGKVVELFHEESGLFGMVPMNTEKESSYVLEKSEKSVDIGLRFASEGALSAAPYRMTGIFDREKWVSLKGLDDFFRDAFVLGLDLSYRAYGHGLCLRSHGAFEVSFPSGDSQFHGADFLKDYDSFLIKNFHSLTRSGWAKSLGLFLSFRWGALMRFRKLLRARAELLSSRIAGDEEILQRFKPAA